MEGKEDSSQQESSSLSSSPLGFCRRLYNFLTRHVTAQGLKLVTLGAASGSPPSTDQRDEKTIPVQDGLQTNAGEEIGAPRKTPARKKKHGNKDELPLPMPITAGAVGVGSEAKVRGGKGPGKSSTWKSIGIREIEEAKDLPKKKGRTKKPPPAEEDGEASDINEKSDAFIRTKKEALGMFRIE